MASEPTDRVILDIRISFERTILVVAEKFLKDLIKKYGKHPLSTDMVELGVLKLADS